jgi:KaiC/GvpD/RAD55 family RecA-like ATPase
MIKKLKSLNRKIFLGYPLDLLLNRKCKLRDYYKISDSYIFHNLYKLEKKNKLNGIEELGGIYLPKINKNGDKTNNNEKLNTGNIVIMGSPGTGKSTLAMQISAACTDENNCYTSVYFALEEEPNSIKLKAEKLGWEGIFKPVDYLQEPLDKKSSEKLAEDLKEILKKASDSENDEISPKVLIPSLSPRCMTSEESTVSEGLFWERYDQIENLLKAASKIEEKNYKEYPPIKLVCIDSLNVFGDKPLDRVELFRLFDLFKRYNIIGVFIVEEDKEKRDTGIHNFIEYMADVVISLTNDFDNGYFIRYLEIKKSNYINQVYGKHPYKILSKILSSADQKRIDKECNKTALIPVIHVYPSLHWIISATER